MIQVWSTSTILSPRVVSPGKPKSRVCMQWPSPDAVFQWLGFRDMLLTWKRHLAIIAHSCRKSHQSQGPFITTSCSSKFHRLTGCYVEKACPLSCPESPADCPTGWSAVLVLWEAVLMLTCIGWIHLSLQFSTTNSTCSIMILKQQPHSRPMSHSKLLLKLLQLPVVPGTWREAHHVTSQVLRWSLVGRSWQEGDQAGSVDQLLQGLLLPFVSCPLDCECVGKWLIYL